jgi:RHS repeat-associated protein
VLDRLNRITSANGTPFSYDANGNLTNDGARTYAYDAANRLVSGGSPSGSITYDALGRLDVLTGALGGRYVYDGVEAVAFADPSTNVIQNHFIRGPGVDEVVANYPAASLTAPLFWLLDERNCLMGSADLSGAMVFTNGYDDYGQPRSGNLGRFQYTGQLFMPDFGAHHYKARAYSPALGRFLQTDPIGYAAGANLYGYVGGDPVNWVDPLGLERRRFKQCATEREMRSSNGLDVTVTCRFVYLDVGIESYFENFGGEVSGFPRVDRSSLAPCPREFYQVSAGVSTNFTLGNGRFGTNNFTLGFSFGFSFNPRTTLGSQFFTQGAYSQSAGRGIAAGASFQAGAGRSARPISYGPSAIAVAESVAGRGWFGGASIQTSNTGPSIQSFARGGIGGGSFTGAGGGLTYSLPVDLGRCEAQ